ncbi:hypothetical protein HNR61_004213 [Actinomadura namibiensis]|uniref:Uncharacterized protein n=1 Tax=Actinomadura namibiensis TaxID=182080 RepID=A0A7W3LQV3_ACTNM|nr:hypothetical protein [Actinomadura namibiensis]
MPRNGAQQQHDTERRAAQQQGTPGHQGRRPVPGARRAVVRGRPPAFDAAAQQRQRGGQHDRGADHGGDHHRDARVGERAEEREGEHQQHRQGRGDRRAAEQHRAARAAHRPRHGLGHLRAAAQLLPEPEDHEQAVVDAQADPHHQGDVGGERRDLGEAQHAAQQRQRPRHREQPDADRHQRRDQPPVDPPQHQQHQRQDHQLGAQEVAAGLLHDLPEHLVAAADAHLEDRAVAGEARGQLRQHLAADPVGVAGHPGQHQGLAGVGPAQRSGAAARPVRPGVADAGPGAQLLGQRASGGGRDRVVDGAVPGGDQQRHVRAAGGVLPGQHVADPHQLRPGRLEPVERQRADRPRADQRRPDRQQHTGGDDPPRPAHECPSQHGFPRSDLRAIARVSTGDYEQSLAFAILC